MSSSNDETWRKSTAFGVRRLTRLRVAVVACGCLFVPLLLGGVAAAKDYYATTQTGFNALNSANFEPGDRILLAGGTTFTGTLNLGSQDTGTDALGNLIAPILITSYGTGRATIAAGDGVAINGYNIGGIEISNLILTGSGVAANGTTTSTKSGISFYCDAPANLKFRHVYIDNVEVSGFGSRGISIGGYNGSAGFDDVRISNSNIHDNLHAGIEIYGYPGITNALTNVTISNCNVHHQPGKAASSGNTGSGIVLAGVTGGVVDHCVSHDNGANNTTSEGPVGIWAYHSANIVFQYNEVYGTQTLGGDGGGFDFDIGTTNSVMQYNYSHDNDGAGFLLYGVADPEASTGHVIRYNVSYNDGRDSASGSASGISLSNNVRDLSVYGNTVLLPAPSGSTSIPAIKCAATNQQPDRIVVSNNNFVTTGGSRLVSLYTTGTVTFAGNNYWSSGSTFLVQDGGTNYSSLAAWRTGKGREKLNGLNTGFNVDPLFQATPSSGGSTSLTSPAGLTAFKLKRTSPLVDAGLDLKVKFGINVGPTDFFGTRIAQGAGYEVGAHEVSMEAPAIKSFSFSSNNRTATLRYQSETGTSFLVRRSSDLRTWTDLPATAAGDGSVMEYTDTPPAGVKWFYVLARE
ncbi:right-handed parallel beta-helix repeat-containing protein [Luteolibacter soli]|uniref:Right-handed parallel beta-helix repeat-containing protein n=1 Tax=Luteolibacter soli TaxID=3135280 RepID=A0ABU9ASD6_9BACT